MSKHDILLDSLDTFFNSAGNLETLRGILDRKTVSLRSLEWYVTVHARQNQTKYTHSGKLFNVHIGYKSSLSGYSKKFFDPFCRTERVQFKGYTTTVAQLNFIRWCIQNDVIINLTRSQIHFQNEELCTHNNTESDCMMIRAAPPSSD